MVNDKWSFRLVVYTFIAAIGARCGAWDLTVVMLPFIACAAILTHR